MQMLRCISNYTDTMCNVFLYHSAPIFYIIEYSVEFYQLVSLRFLCINIKVLIRVVGATQSAFR
jgi:hypothetical protein